MTDPAIITDAIIEATARVLRKVGAPRASYDPETPAVIVGVDEASAAVIAAVTPMIEAAALEKAGGWQPIESAPRDGSTIDLWGAERERYVNSRIAECFWFKEKWMHHRTIHDEENLEDFAEVFHVSHWRSLPHPPKEEKP